MLLERCESGHGCKNGNAFLLGGARGGSVYVVNVSVMLLVLCVVYQRGDAGIALLSICKVNVSDVRLVMLVDVNDVLLASLVVVNGVELV